MPSTNRPRRHKRRDASGGAKAVIERQLIPVDKMEESRSLGRLLTPTRKQACDSESTQRDREAQKSGDHRNVERVHPPETNSPNKDAPKLKDNEIRKISSQGDLMAEDGPWNTVSLSSDEESGWAKINRDDYEPEQHAVSDIRHDVSRADAGTCIEDDYVNLEEEDWELDEKWTPVDV